MLSEREKKEFIEDGLSEKRRRDFARVKKAPILSGRSLDELLKFLKEAQQFSSPEFLLREKKASPANKL